jgi:predicted phosphohydrolase
MLKITAVSDTHWTDHRLWDLKLPDGDVLIHAGDATFLGRKEEFLRFFIWFQAQPFDWKLFVPGNHDFMMQHGDDKELKDLLDIHDPGVVILRDTLFHVNGISFLGLPYSLEYRDWAFGINPAGMEEVLLPHREEDVDVLISHGPPYGIGDKNLEGEHLGLQPLTDFVRQQNVMFHVFGHIHEGYGIYPQVGNSVLINASICNRDYGMKNDPISFSIDG